ncbi:MAG: SUMF1/EgtB/PvdO family nonheme iron enzyme [Planctomycetes bacterium]|nr:SUMF1/EgtB/PvdO family nonheme iron enzyme [Planctomycetota bacterium]
MKKGDRKQKPASVDKEKRYTLGRELGRGGLGRVVEAQDARTGRAVALKLLLDGAPLELVERFRREGRITARLEHPNIVPVYDLGVLPAGKGPAEIFFAMKKIAGRDMADVLGGMRRGTPTPGWPQRRLVEALRDACRALAFAHSRGVIHRDLKPSNIMLGEFGETLVVDWGLARAPGEAAEPMKGTAGGGDALTLAGDVMGTPEYMPPEQASGDIEAIDARSDVYALGAILYEILCGRPPFTGNTALEILSKVVSSAPEAPSAVVRRRASEIPARPGTAASSRWPDVPADLETACLRALSHRKEDRFADASALAAELDAHLEGTRERERRRALATEFAAQAAADLAKSGALESEAAAARTDAGRLDREIPNHAPREEKMRLWAAEDRAEQFAREAARLAAQANASLDAALANSPDHAEARRLMAEFHWDGFVKAEAADDRRGMILHRAQAERWNDGALNERLRGEGRLTLRTSAYACACLREAHDVPPDRLNVLGFHPWSGRRLEGPQVECVAELELAAPIALRVHSPACDTKPAPGAEAWAWRFEEIDRVLVPVSALEGGLPCPSAALDRAFGNSPYRPRGPGLHLGPTPVKNRALPVGSWLVVVVPGKGPPVRVPVEVKRLERVEVEVTVFAEGEIPAGFELIAGGAFHSQGDPGNPASGPAAIVDVADFFVSKSPVTCAEYAAFLMDLDRSSAEEAAMRVPRMGKEGVTYWPRLPGGGYAVPDAAWLAAASPELRAQARRLDTASADWHADWPVLGISWADAMAYARWKSMRDGRLYTLLHEDQCEKAARGVDGRGYPWGRHFDTSLCNSYGSHGDGFYPVPVTATPWDESPYGIRQLAGNSWNWCLNDPGLGYGTMRIGKGGAFSQAPPRNRASHSGVNHIHAAFFTNGLRLAAACRLTPPGETWYRETRGQRPKSAAKRVNPSGNR